MCEKRDEKTHRIDSKINTPVPDVLSAKFVSRLARYAGPTTTAGSADGWCEWLCFFALVAPPLDSGGAVVAMKVKGDRAALNRLVEALQIFVLADSLGGVESLIEHRASIEGAGSPCPPDLLRLSIGLEDTGDLIGDLEQALDGV